MSISLQSSIILPAADDEERSDSEPPELEMMRHRHPASHVKAYLTSVPRVTQSFVPVDWSDKRK